MAEPTVFPEMVSFRPTGNATASRVEVDPTIDHDISARVHELLMLLAQPVGMRDRRGDRRYAYPYLVRLTPLANDNITPAGPMMMVVGKSLSEHGFGFYHQNPLPNRRVATCFNAGDHRWLGLVLDLRWCRFAGQGWYESGGRFVNTFSAAPTKSGSPASNRTDADATDG
ncbi:MAG TPA: hypothetical protein VGI75_08600 [Pirellulales bacterium]|jgi:hypothetical protein